MALDPVVAIRQQAARDRIEQSRTSQQAIDAALRKTHRAPIAISIGYSGFLASVQEALNEQARKASLQAMNALGLRSDAHTEEHVARIFDPVTQANEAITTPGAPIAVGVAVWSRTTEEFSEDKYDSEVMIILGVGALSAEAEDAFLASWIRENLLLIQNVNAVQLQQLETLLLRATREGLANTAIESEIARILSVSIERARLIARDQIGKLVGQLDRARQLEGGLNRFFWRTQQDERVRPAHQSLNGRSFSWDTPPAIGFPGQPIQCRCTAEPDLSALLPVPARRNQRGS